MKKFLAGVATLAMVAGGSSVVLAQEIATGDADVTLESALDIEAALGLNFGVIAIGNTAGTVVLDPATSAITDDPANNIFSTDAALAQAGTFDVTGVENIDVSVDLPLDITLDGEGDAAGSTLTVDALTTDPVAPFNLGTEGSETLAIGGTLQIGADQATGAYSGTYDVTVDFN